MSRAAGVTDWYKDAIFYEVHVKAFMDSNGDGIGDFAGLTARLDYLQELGVDCLWLLPVYASPLRDDGYDIADFYTLHPSYGTVAEFRTLLDAAHARGLRVIADLVMNHTSDQHPWFQASRAAEGALRRLLRVESHGPALPGRAYHLHRYREIELDVGHPPPRLLLAPLLQPPT